MINDRQNFTSRQTYTSNHPVKVKRKTFDNGQSPVTTVTGYPILWNQNSSDRGGYVVRLAPNSAIFSNPMLALWNHDFSKPLASTSNDTIRILAADDVGVPVEIDLDENTTAGADAAAYANSKIGLGFSFSMANGFEDYSESKEGDTNVVTVSKFTSDELTLTIIPAFAGTVSTLGTKETLEPMPVGTPPVAGGMSSVNSAKHQLRRSKLDLLKM